MPPISVVLAVLRNFTLFGMTAGSTAKFTGPTCGHGKTAVAPVRRANRQLAKDARVTESVMMTNYVEETDEQMRQQATQPSPEFWPVFFQRSPSVMVIGQQSSRTHLSKKQNQQRRQVIGRKLPNSPHSWLANRNGVRVEQTCENQKEAGFANSDKARFFFGSSSRFGKSPVFVKSCEIRFVPQKSISQACHKSLSFLDF